MVGPLTAMRNAAMARRMPATMHSQAKADIGLAGDDIGWKPAVVAITPLRES